MALSDSVAIYTAASNLDAHFVRDRLVATGIEAFVVEDVSQVGTFVGGLIPGLHKPQVWVDRANVGRAEPIVIDFDESTARLAEGHIGTHDAAQPINVVCEECDQLATFPAAQRGSVQQCPHCGDYVDVGETDQAGDWCDAAEDSDEME